MNIKRSLRKLFKKSKREKLIVNLYKTDYKKHVLVSYLISPFQSSNHFMHQNYITSHIVAESFSELGYNVDVVDYQDVASIVSYEKYELLFGFGQVLERSFYISNRNIPRILFVTGAHEDLHNSMGLKSIRDFYKLTGLWMPHETNILTESTYYSMFSADLTIILARGYIFEDYKSRFENKLYSLNNNILGSFSQFELKTAESRNNDFLFLSGARLLTKGLHLVLEVAKMRHDLNFYIIVPHINAEFEGYYKDILHHSSNVFLFRNLRMDSLEMQEIIEKCSYSIASSYIDGLPGGTIEPMSAGLIPIVSKYCGFPREKFIFEMEDLSPAGLNDTINRALNLSDVEYAEYSTEVKAYTLDKFSAQSVKNELIGILKHELERGVIKAGRV